MTERTLVVDQLKFSYEGLFDTAELYKLIDGWFYEKGWDKRELMNEELVTPAGRQIRIVLEPWKTISDYFKLFMQVKLNIHDVKDVEIEKQGQKIKINQGEIKIIFNGYVLSDASGEWNQKPFWWFLSILANKYLFKENYGRAERWILSDVDDLYQKIKSFLNVYKYQFETTPITKQESRL
ncbi:MAG: hypothetical protein CMI53_02835 [Parcubacteria group bacterium]|nr:hypothetical protein [Parcubacteria group bacterium]